MKKILILTLLLLLLAGCVKKPKLLVDTATTITTSVDQIPAVTELIEEDEDITVKEELVGNKLIVEATTKNDEYVYEYTISYEPLEIDGTLAKQDISQFFSDSQKAKAATYSLNNDIMTITYEDNSFNVSVIVDMPEVSVDEDITIDVYTGYDFENFIHESEGVTHEYTYEDGILTVAFTKNDWSEVITRDVTKVDSSPYPRSYIALGWWGPGDKWYTNEYDLILTLNGDGTGTWHNVGISKVAGRYIGGSLTYDDEYIYANGKTYPYWFDDEGFMHRIETDGLDEVIYERTK